MTITDPLLFEELNRQAIDAALNCRWEEAVELNTRLLESIPSNTEYLNRLAKAQFELCNYSQAKKIYQEVLQLDPYNSIAQKNFKKVTSIKKGDGVGKVNHSQPLSPGLFLEEPGITTLVNLVKVAEPQKLLTLSSGTAVNMIAKKRSICIMDSNNQYLGAFPDDSSFHLLKLLKGGNKYLVIIKSVKPNGLTVLVRETYRSKKFKNQASFLMDSSTTMNFASDNIPLITDSSSDDSDDGSGSEEMMA